MKKTKCVRLSIDIPTELYKVMKLYLVEKNLSIRSYVLNLIGEDLKKELKNYSKTKNK